MGEGRLMGRVAPVTGAASGIGAAVARRLAEEGAAVVGADLAEVPAAPGVEPQALDVADPASVEAAVAAVLARHGRIDSLVHAAGIGQEIPFLDTPLATFDRIIAVNLGGTFLVGQRVARAMRDAGGGAIVNIASVAGLRGSIGRAAYGGSKGGVVIMSQVMAVDLAPMGIRVNVVAPGPIETPMVVAMHDAAIRAAWQRQIPLRRYGEAHEVAAACLFLVSDEASFVTGHVLAVDGGFAGGGIVTRADPDALTPQAVVGRDPST
jgi:NAD(P)-dependent dehydrogenase (short-subunit alcohol dehydrogenase family)